MGRIESFSNSDMSNVELRLEIKMHCVFWHAFI